MEGKLRKEMEAKLEAEREKLRSQHRADVKNEVRIKCAEHRMKFMDEKFKPLLRKCIDLEAGHLKAQIATLEKQAKPQPKPKPQPGTAALNKQIAALESENKALTAKLTKVES